MNAASVRRTRASIEIPLRADDRDSLLRHEWRVFEAPYMPDKKSLRLGFSGNRQEDLFRASMEIARLDELFLAEVYCDALGGSSGQSKDAFKDKEIPQVVINFMRRGELKLTNGGSLSVKSGDLCIRTSEQYWEFSYSPCCRTQVAILPARPVIAAANIARLPSVTLLSGESLEAHVLRSYFDLALNASSGLTVEGARACLGAAIELTAGAILQRGIPIEPWAKCALHAAACTLIESELSRRDLKPSWVAERLHVSVRTLHRAFAETDEPMMVYVLRRRLEMARRDLLAEGGDRLSITDIAARWNFADLSHFTRAFKSRFNMTPSAIRRDPVKLSPNSQEVDCRIGGQ
jgi:AraC-like DNA-binding protein